MELAFSFSYMNMEHVHFLKINFKNIRFIRFVRSISNNRYSEHIIFLSMKVDKFFLIVFFPCFFFSCVTIPKDVAYFQDLDASKKNIRIEGDSGAYEPVIKKFDELMITVSAPVLEQEAVAQFNLPITTYLTPGETNNFQQSISVQTFIVDHDGAIDYPVIGRIPLAGLTKSQAIDRIKKSVSNHINNPVVVLKILSFKVTVLGEVLKPGTIPVSQEKISILDAIGYAGDLTIYGNRKNVLLIRENNTGANEFVRIDLTSSDLFTSPYYYLQQNDKIIVEPNKTKQLESRYSSAESYKLSTYSMIFNALSVVASVTAVIVSLSKK